MTRIQAILLGGTLAAFALPSQAALIYVGQWRVDDGPHWTAAPAPKSAQEVAAFLFGGNPSDYSISTVDADPANVDFQAWYSGFGSGSENIAPILPGGPNSYPAGSKLPQNAVFDGNGDGLYNEVGDYSPYIQDWAVGEYYTNYAFIDDSVIPEPSGALVLAGLMSVGMMSRVRRGR